MNNIFFKSINEANGLSLVSDLCREIADNMRIESIPANSFQGIAEESVDM